jgi:hypothetical protein
MCLVIKKDQKCCSKNISSSTVFVLFDTYVTLKNDNVRNLTAITVSRVNLLKDHMLTTQKNFSFFYSEYS